MRENFERRENMEISNAMVIGLGLGTVFAGLVGLILICYIMSSVVKLFAPKEKKETLPTSSKETPIANKGELAAAIACAIAEDLGKDVTGIRIKSIKKI